MVMKPQPFFEAVESLHTKPPLVFVAARKSFFPRGCRTIFKWRRS